MFIVDEKEKEYRFGNSGPKYLMQGPRMNFALVRFDGGQDFRAHYHEVMEENFFILEGTVTIAVNGTPYDVKQGQLIHIEPGEVHYVTNRTDSPVRMIAALSPYKDGDKVEVDNPKLD